MAITLISEQVLGATTATVTFSSIPATYKDLMVEMVVAKSATTGNITMQFNGVTTTTYSWTRVSGNGTSATSARSSGATSITLDTVATFTTAVQSRIIDIPNYANTVQNKCLVSRAGTTSVGLDVLAGYWRSTAAISSIAFTGSSFASGSIFRLWGIA